MALGVVGAVAVTAAEPPSSASMILQELRAFRECGSVLYIAAHPDDENTQFLAYMARGRGVRTGYLSLTRGEGGQDLIGPEIGDPLGVIRTQELLAARRIDGAEQFFTRARDFGFSKSYEETLTKWGKQEVLSDVVGVIREFRPDVIVTRFPPEPGNTHGHHTASTVLALEAFKLAGDPKAFPEQLGGLSGPVLWQPKRIYWNSFRDAHGSTSPLRLDIGGYLPLLGESIGEIAARSRSSHRSQGYGTIAVRGSRMDDFQPLDDQPAGRDLFDGIDTTWGRWRGCTAIPAIIDDIVAHFDPQNPAASVPALFHLRKNCVEARQKIILGEEFPNKGADVEAITRKLVQLEGVLQDCLGIYIETTIPQAEVVPGETIHLRHTVLVRSSAPVSLTAVMAHDAGPWGPPEILAQKEVVLHANQPVVQELDWHIRASEALSQPYWLSAAGTSGLYGVDEYVPIGQADNPALLTMIDDFHVGNESLQLNSEPMQISSDPIKGEVHRKLVFIPPVTLTLTREVELFTPESDRTVQVEVKAYRPNQTGTMKLAAPAGWTVAPNSQPFHLAAVGDHARLTFTVHAPSQKGTAFLTAEATVGGHTYDTARQEIRYDHIPFQLLQPPARLKAVCLDLQIRGKQVGYLPGAGDRTAEALEAMGYAVTTLSGADLTPDRLKVFDAVVIGVRAFNVRTDLAPGLPALFAYVENGGTVVEQYNTPNELKNPRLAPYQLELSRNLPQQRVTDENAPITLLAPDHPAFNVPNRIMSTDFDGWVQERGLNFPVAWDTEHFETLLACSDPGEPPLKSGLLVAHHGKGYFVYTGLSFFRQLPAGVPGAYRLFANLVSLGK